MAVGCDERASNELLTNHESKTVLITSALNSKQIKRAASEGHIIKN